MGNASAARRAMPTGRYAAVQIAASHGCLLNVGWKELFAHFDGSRQTCPYHLGYPRVLMMKASEEGNGGERSDRLHGTTKRDVLFERKVGKDAIVIVGIGSEDLAQMGLAQDQDMVQAFAADRADDALDIGILPRRSRCSDDLLDSHRLDTITEGLTIRRVAVSQQEARCGVPREGFGDLARQPDLCRVLRDIEMDDCSSLMAEDDQGPGRREAETLP